MDGVKTGGIWKKCIEEEVETIFYLVGASGIDKYH